MKLELKHIVPYSLYDLHWLLQGRTKLRMSGISGDNLHCSDGSVYDWKSWIELAQALYPILRPLSDLTKEIVIDGENVLFCDYITDKYGDCETFYSFNDGAIIEDAYRGEDAIHHKHSYPNTECYPYFIIKELLILHFDIFGLIKEGLAIDINTIN